MIKILKSLCFKAIIKNFPNLHKQVNVKEIDICAAKENFSFHFQFNDAMKLCKIIKKDPFKIAELIKNSIEKKISEKFIKIELSSPGFINFTIKNEFINKKINKKLKIKIKKKEIIVLDYSSPNIAKDMHVGHLRSTIIGDCLSKILNYLGHKVIKISHLGDWGTQFGILIKYIKNIYNISDIKKLKLKNLSNLYKNAQKISNENENFKDDAKKEVIKLQKKEKETIKIWKEINKISKKEYKKIYAFLNIKIKYKGESFYNELLNPLIKYLEKKRFIVISDNAKCIYTTDINNRSDSKLPLIVQKSDGGYNYATTDLAALYYRIKYNKADKIIYITDVGQKIHFQMIFDAINKTKINKFTKLVHIPIGLMLTPEGKKIKTRDGESEKLINLIKKSISYSKKILRKKNNITNINENAKILGINTLKYSDLSNKIDQNYIFDYNKILQYTGNTASFINYAYVRINGIKNKVKGVNNNIKINIIEKEELDLALHLLQYVNIMEKTADDLNPNILTNYLYKLAEKFHSFFHKCNVINSENTNSRLILCKKTSHIIKKSMNLLGLKIIKKM